MGLSEETGKGSLFGGDGVNSRSPEAEYEYLKNALSLNREISLRLGDRDELKYVVEEAMILLVDFFNMDFACFYFMENFSLKVMDAIGLPKDSFAPTFPLSPEIQEVRLGSRESGEMDRLAGRMSNQRAHSWILVPLKVADEFIGTIFLGSLDEKDFGLYDAGFIEALGIHTGVYVQNAISRRDLREYSMELDRRVRERTIELQALYELSREIGHSMDYGSLLETTLETVEKVMDYDLAGYLLKIDNQPKFVIHVNRPVTDEVLEEYRESLLSRFAEVSSSFSPEDREELFCKIEKNEMYSEYDEELEGPIETTYFLPLKIDFHVVGILNISSFRPRSFTPDQVRILNTVALQASISITQLQQFLATRTTTFQSILENISSGVVLVDRDYSVKMANPAGDQLLKQLSGIEVGDRLRKIGSIEIEDLVDDIFWNQADNKKHEIMVTGKTNLYFQIMVSPFRLGDNRVIGAIIVIQNITEEKIASQQLLQFARMVSVGELAAGVAHEINNPLTSILGFSELLLQQDGLTPYVKEIIGDIFSSGQRAARITQDLLYFARDQRDQDREIINLCQVIDRTVKLVESQYNKLGIGIVRNYQGENISIIGIPGKIQQVLLNLVGNAKDAIKMSGKGSQIVLSAWREQNGSAVLTIRDDGPGIPEEIRDRIFDPFFTTKEVGKGTGLGLSITYKIIKDHQAEVFLESEEGKFTKFRIHFPPPDSHREGRSKLKQAPKREIREKMRILAIDDEMMILRFIKKFYSSLGYQVTIVNNPLDGLSLLEEEDFDLIILDFRMPEMNGDEIHGRILARKPEYADKIVMVTGDVMGEEVKSFLERTKIPYMLKPINISNLRKLVEKQA